MADKKTSIVFIAGLGHSGSTLLNFLLGSQNQITGLGEVDKILNSDSRDKFMKRYISGEKYPCSCRELPSDCPFWKPYSTIIKNNDLTYAGYYKELIRICREELGSDFIADSSKNINSLDRLYSSLPEIGVPHDQFFVIHLVKDVRSMAVSNIRSKNRTSSIWKSYNNWKEKNLVIDSYLNSNNIQSINIGYEELAISTGFIMNSIAEFLGLDIPSVKSTLNPMDSHILFGNKMRLNDKHANSIEYDYQWFTEPKVSIPYLFSSKIRRLNNNWVYSNVGKIYASNNKYTAPMRKTKKN